MSDAALTALVEQPTDDGLRQHFEARWLRLTDLFRALQPAPATPEVRRQRQLVAKARYSVFLDLQALDGEVSE